eukprot:CFRG6078T1
MTTDWRQAEKTLACLLQGMLGQKIYLELRDESEIFGTLTDADAKMNTMMKDVTLTNSKGEVIKLPFLFTKGRYLRSVPIPDRIDPIAVIHQHIHQTKRSKGVKRKYIHGENRARPGKDGTTGKMLGSSRSHLNTNDYTRGRGRGHGRGRGRGRGDPEGIAERQVDDHLVKNRFTYTSYLSDVTIT